MDDTTSKLYADGKSQIDGRPTDIGIKGWIIIIGAMFSTSLKG